MLKKNELIDHAVIAFWKVLHVFDYFDDYGCSYNVVVWIFCKLNYLN